MSSFGIHYPTDPHSTLSVFRRGSPTSPSSLLLLLLYSLSFHQTQTPLFYHGSSALLQSLLIEILLQSSSSKPHQTPNTHLLLSTLTYLPINSFAQPLTFNIPNPPYHYQFWSRNQLSHIYQQGNNNFNYSTIWTTQLMTASVPWWRRSNLIA